MAVIRIPHKIWQETYNHLFDTRGEHFAFFLAKWSTSGGNPVFLVNQVLLVPDNLVENEFFSYEISTEGILQAVNIAIKNDYCLIEIHNHGGDLPRWSKTDEEGFDTFVPYIFDSLPNKPYAATVWGNETVFGEYFLPDGQRGIIESITVFGQSYTQIVSRDDDKSNTASIFDRQKIWFSENGQKQLARYKIAIVGNGETGSHVIQQLAYLGCRDFVLIDDDIVEDTNLNRLVTASHTDISIPKVFVGQQTIKRVAPSANVKLIQDNLKSEKALDFLKGVDFIFGCVDNDGARLILNELALAYSIPYFDLATEIHTESNSITEIGGRVVFVNPNGETCLNCMKEIDAHEASIFLSTAKERQENIDRGYISGFDIKNPSVVSLNGQVASTAINEFAIYISDIRNVSSYLSIDVLGIGRGKNSQWINPQSFSKQQTEGCPSCTLRGIGEQINLERFYKQGIITLPQTNPAPQQAPSPPIAP